MNANATVSVGIFALFIVAAVALGLLSLRGRDKANLAEWSVGGRSLGVVLIFVLMAGETYTSFSYLGAAGWAYDYGMPVFYLVAYLAIGFAVGYVVGPILWHYAHRHHLHNITDITSHRFDSPWLGGAVAVLTTVFLLPYIQLQITGMGVVVSTISYGTISLGVGYVVAFVVAEAFIIASGLRGSAWVSILKDGLVIITLLVVFVYVPLHYFGGFGPLLDRLVAERPQWLMLPGQGKESLGMLWFATTGLLNGVVYTIFPTTVAGYLGARSPAVLRRNAIIMPFYQVLLFVPILLGLAAVFVVPGLGDSNLAMFELVVDSMPAWLVGLVGVAGALSSIVPMAVFMLVIGTMWGRSILGAHPRTAPHQKRLSQLVTFLVGLLALVFTFASPTTLVQLSVLSYQGLAQLLPVVLVGLLWRRMSTAGAASGLAAGVAVVAVLVVTGNDPLLGINAGLLGLVVNFAVNVAVSLARPADTPADRLAVPELREAPSARV
ncbi:SSS family solute:Na+ symporter [Saccharopolyspora erythraea NRRL 2338]|uniref:Sodium:solute symporter n=2 Tax=Saccharopolyspora erythraea TaxID=1836 RepID=A4FN89_SACEN|nr:sodium:solute symporter family protein [Saccharopolyspora erythraea]EQD82206.1 sodium:solute symporter [Saccharopolyspora erythraea D]PFG99155.1 SSS family solute:Na+ symporter [Saccharopolyspora erythraea NRRL 2338]QRK89107.1 sodium:solute symporter family protein [Saccharopolyspora erythraea]CAM05514.1 sodium:solute symporter [Saccharopolyspora erythraea NRRL 2338]